MNDKNVREWKGTQEDLPEVWEKFTYNGVTYIIVLNDRRRFVVTADEGEPDIKMSIRMFPGHTGAAEVDVVIKSGVATVDEVLAAVGDQKNPKALVALIRRYSTVALAQDHPEEWSASKGITMNELDDLEDFMSNALAFSVMEKILS